MLNSVLEQRSPTNDTYKHDGERSLTLLQSVSKMWGLSDTAGVQRLGKTQKIFRQMMGWE
jgi:hypothetical protein